MQTLQARIARLKYANQSRKAVRRISGSKIRFISQTSQEFSGSGEWGFVRRIRFTPSNPSDGGISMIDLRTQSSFPQESIRSVNEPQSGDGSVVIRVTVAHGFAPRPVSFRIVATGTSRGIFEQI